MELNSKPRRQPPPSLLLNIKRDLLKEIDYMFFDKKYDYKIIKIKMDSLKQNKLFNESKELILQNKEINERINYVELAAKNCMLSDGKLGKIIYDSDIKNNVYKLDGIFDVLKRIWINIYLIYIILSTNKIKHTITYDNYILMCIYMMGNYTQNFLFVHYGNQCLMSYILTTPPFFKNYPKIEEDDKLHMDLRSLNILLKYNDYSYSIDIDKLKTYKSILLSLINHKFLIIDELTKLKIEKIKEIYDHTNVNIYDVIVDIIKEMLKQEIEFITVIHNYVEKSIEQSIQEFVEIFQNFDKLNNKLRDKYVSEDDRYSHIFGYPIFSYISDPKFIAVLIWTINNVDLCNISNKDMDLIKKFIEIIKLPLETHPKFNLLFRYKLLQLYYLLIFSVRYGLINDAKNRKLFLEDVNSHLKNPGDNEQIKINKSKISRIDDLIKKLDNIKKYVSVRFNDKTKKYRHLFTIISNRYKFLTEKSLILKIRFAPTMIPEKLSNLECTEDRDDNETQRQIYRKYISKLLENSTEINNLLLL